MGSFMLPFWVRSRLLRGRGRPSRHFVLTAASLDEAANLAEGCPVLLSGGTVEVRPVMKSE
jgi:hypothetical protein